MPDNIILIGFMAAGKDTVARAIAAKTGWAYLSLDRLIELKTGLKVADLFRRRGESDFRKVEKAVLASVMNLKKIVLATGGGTVLDAQNRRRLKRMGLVIHLRADLSTLEKRLKYDRVRPLIRDKTRIREIFTARRGQYDFADWNVDTDAQNPARIADRIIEKAGIGKPSYPERIRTIEVRASNKNYPVIIAAGVLSRNSTLAPYGQVLSRGLIITNPVVAALYLDRVIASFRRSGIELLPCVVPEGERLKNLDTVRRIYDLLARKGYNRGDCLVALGGGVITDLTGFIAATYKRGMKLFHIPTTLLAQVDAAIGGKTGVNHAYGKNLIGAFYPPDLVACDPVMLLSLPDREFRNGLAEVVKYGFIAQARLFEQLEADPGAVMERSIGLLADLVGSCADLKRRIVEQDEREEKGRREILNFGHTVGHALERCAGFKRLRHGPAVAVGMVEESRRAIRKGALSRRDGERLKKLLECFGLPTAWPVGISRLALRRYIRQDKKIRAGRIRIPMPVRVGKIKIKEVKWENFL
jgi:3-dehydroquinate synthase